MTFLTCNRSRSHLLPLWIICEEDERLARSDTCQRRARLYLRAPVSMAVLAAVFSRSRRSLKCRLSVNSERTSCAS